MRSLLLAALLFGLPAVAFSEDAEPASPAAAFLDTIGVATHLTSAWDTAYSNCANGGGGDGGDCRPNIERIAAALRFAGIHHIRDSLVADYVNQRVRLLASAVPGLRVDFVVSDDRDGPIAKQLTRTAPDAGLVDLIEGPNEPNNPPSNFSYQKRGFPEGARAAMHDLRAAMQGTAFAHTPLVNSALGGGTPADYTILGNVPEADFGSSHAYIGTSPPRDFVAGLTPSRTIAVGKPMVITETGNCTLTTVPTWCGVSEAVQAKYALMILADAFRLGVRRTYLYELVDEQPDPQQTDDERHFGLFHHDWTPKPVAVALHNLNRELGVGDGGTCAGRLGYSLPDTKSVLLRRADGVFVILAWTEAALWNPAERTEVAVPPHEVALTLAAGHDGSHVRVIDPMTDASVDAGPPRGGALRIVLPDHPVLIEIGGTACN